MTARNLWCGSRSIPGLLNCAGTVWKGSSNASIPEVIVRAIGESDRDLAAGVERHRATQRLAVGGQRSFPLPRETRLGVVGDEAGCRPTRRSAGAVSRHRRMRREAVAADDLRVGRQPRCLIQELADRLAIGRRHPAARVAARADRGRCVRAPRAASRRWPPTVPHFASAFANPNAASCTIVRRKRLRRVHDGGDLSDQQTGRRASSLTCSAIWVATNETTTLRARTRPQCRSRRRAVAEQSAELVEPSQLHAGS